MPTPRQDLALAIARMIQREGGAVISLLPPPPHDHVVFVAAAPVAEPIVAALREAGYRVNALGTTQRLEPHAVREEVRERMDDGQIVTRVVHGAGFQVAQQFEVRLPSDADLARLRIQGPPPKPKPHRQDKVESERVRRRRAKAQ